MIIRVPAWLIKLIFRKQLRELEKRTDLTGRASASKRTAFGEFSISVAKKK